MSRVSGADLSSHDGLFCHFSGLHFPTALHPGLVSQSVLYLLVCCVTPPWSLERWSSYPSGGEQGNQSCSPVSPRKSLIQAETLEKGAQAESFPAGGDMTMTVSGGPVWLMPQALGLICISLPFLFYPRLPGFGISSFLELLSVFLKVPAFSHSQSL